MMAEPQRVRNVRRKSIEKSFPVVLFVLLYSVVHTFVSIEIQTVERVNETLKV